uniref:Hemerythrin n=1 Tax=Lumbrinerides crassicephala TaxID=3266300 RepID=A0A286RT45_9ANNE|nr:hemerythrin [Lumbrineris crassicephala]
MGEKIPEPYVWDESFKVFYENLDDEHRMLFKAVFTLADDKTSVAALRNLVEVATYHFTDEEVMMQKKNDSNYPSHKKVHDEFLSNIKGLKAPVDDKTIHYAKDWLVNHIKGIDFKYKGHL